MKTEPLLSLDLPRLDCVVIGAGFSGLYAIHRLLQDKLTVRCFEAADDVGGVWLHNCYPGAQCDVPSRDYCYSFSQELLEEWQWKKRYAGQSEILAYARHVADRFGLRRHIAFQTRVVSAVYEPETAGWIISTDKGDRVWAQYCFAACGHLSTPSKPSLPGLEDFRGEWYHTGNWPRQQIDFSDKRVGVIGTGSSGIQVITELAKTAAHLTAFIRTPQFSLPVRNADVDQEQERQFVKGYQEYREMVNQTFAPAYFQDVKSARSAIAEPPERREERYEEQWRKGGISFLRTYDDIMVVRESNDTAADFVRGKIRSIVRDPAVANLLTPVGYPIGTKRIPLDDGFYQAFNRSNVKAVDVKKAPISRVTPSGINTTDAEYPLDVLVFATGYDAFTGTLYKMDIRGREGVPLPAKWKDGPLNYLGLMTAGFPNFFFMQGPGSTSVLASVITGAQQQVDWFASCIRYMRAQGLRTIDPSTKAEQEWVEHCNELANRTLLPQTDSWWNGSNIPGKPRVFLPYTAGFKSYKDACDAAANDQYRGFLLE